MRVIASFLLMTWMGALGAYFFKLGMGGEDKFSIKKLLECPWIYLGAGFYIGSAALNIWLLRVFDYTVLYPMTAITYVWTLILSVCVLKERLTLRKLFAICFIVLGVILLNVS